MATRLNKITRELNVGLQTAVDFLHKKGYQDVKSDPNTKISDEECELLIKEFGKDKSIRLQSDKLSQERYSREKPKVETPVQKQETVNIEVERPQLNVVGKINLDELNSRKQLKSDPELKSKVEQKVEQTVEQKVEQKVEPKVEQKVTSVPQPSIVEQPKQEIKEEVIPSEIIIEKSISPQEVVVEVVESVPEQKVVEPTIQEKPTLVHVEKMEEKQEVAQEKAEEGTEELFRLNKPELKMNIQTVGFVDLSAINSQTRPAKKTKEERNKEREDKKAASRHDKPHNKIPQPIKAGTAKSDQESEDAKKKRNRIARDGGVKVDPKTVQGVNGARPSKPTKNGNTHGGNNPHAKNNAKSNLSKKPFVKEEVSDEDVQKQIKETLARLTSKPNKSGAKYRKEKRTSHSLRQELEYQDQHENKVLKVTEFVTANDLANMMNVPVIQIISTCMNLGQMVSINQRLDAEIINIVAEEFGFTTEYVSAELVEAISQEIDAEEDLVSRPPIVTVMGHVDHGKTSLLDFVRKTNVIAGEAGGITQHIGAYHVKMKDGRVITFLDTPGHEAFTAMRARGAKVTDIAIIIVAADDSVMPQTIEAINHASAANVPIVFAINKIDKAGANPEKIKEVLANMNYLVEDWGGKYQSQEISAKKGIGVDELLEKVLLEAELLDLKANPDRKAQGSVIESSLDKGRGYVATVLIETGTLRVGDTLIAGQYFGKVKAMFNERNQRLKEAGPSEPVIILGLNGAPTAGDQFNVLDSEQEAREIANKREQLQREQSIRTHKMLTLDDIGRRIAIGNFQELNIIVKGDVDGSVEALSDSLIRLSTEQIQVNVIHKAVGQISDSDAVLAAASQAIIIGFQVRPSTSARRLAEKEGVDIRQYSIIYDAIEEVKDAMEGMLSPIIKEEITATIEIRETFKITKVGTIAGCMVKEGTVKRNNKIRLIRDGIVIFTGELASLKRFKDDVKEVKFGYECGLNIANYNDIRVGDIIESFEEVEVKQTL